MTAPQSWGNQLCFCTSVFPSKEMSQDSCVSTLSFPHFLFFLLLLFPSISSRLDNNQFKDNVMELLGSVLSVKDCQIQRLR